MVAVGGGVTVTVVGADVALQPFASVTVTVNVPLLVTLIVGAVTPLDQT